MKAFKPLRLAVAAAAFLVAGAASAERPGAAPERATATSTVVADAAPVPQRQASAPTSTATDATVPAAPPAVDWGYTPRRAFQARRR